LWLSFITLIATAIQAKYGFAVSPEYQGYALAAVVAIVRLLTNGPVTATQTTTPVQDAQVYAAQAAATADKANAAAASAEKVVAKEQSKETAGETGPTGPGAGK
jgi:hypothetical protein